MTRDLLWRGMLAGILAALLATLFARQFAEPQVDVAIAFEATQAEHAMGGHQASASEHAGEEPELVSRETQKGWGLLTATLLYGAAVGGIFSLIFAAGYGRLAMIGPRTLALMLGILAFLVVALIPAIKYPPTPPAVGQHETVALRTVAYFAMIVLSVAGCMIAIRVRGSLVVRLGAFNALLAGFAAFAVVVGIGQLLLPAVNEVPPGFPATSLWDFRVASLGMQFVLWMAIALIFGAFAHDVIRKAVTSRQR
ncbi:Uncharacterized membrane protein, predicted cobalt tansporter CbtA [Sphingobium faniae]|nr:Uncharacterized membrane protein, predicted cobalt tansporter CbtA [Sphingobium faniae]